MYVNKLGILALFSLVAGFLMTADATSQGMKGFETPEAALQGLEQAYRDNNVEAAVAASDFMVVAKLIAVEGRVESRSAHAGSWEEDPELLEASADLMETSFRLDFQEKGFPDFQNAVWQTTEKREVQEGLVALTEVCTFSGRLNHPQVMLVSNWSGAWKVVGLAEQFKLAISRLNSNFKL